jgi:hypothetical protein
MARIARHDAIVKTARLTHQRIDLLGQQKTCLAQVDGGDAGEEAEIAHRWRLRH